MKDLEHLDIKPLSVNDAWKGRRYKTQQYKAFEQELMCKLPAKIEIPEGKLKLLILFGFSSKGSDWDNPIKPFVDVLQKKYSFNDNRIYESFVGKIIVFKGEEFIKFRFSAVG